MSGPATTSAARLPWLVLRHPGEAMAELAERPGRLWLWPCLALALFGAVAAAATLPQQREAMLRGFEAAQIPATEDAVDEETAAQREASLGVMFRVGAIAAVVGSLIAPFVAALALAGALHLVGTALGGHETFQQMLTVISWARLPLVGQAMLRMAYGFGGGYDERMDGLAGLVSGESMLGPVLAEVSLWNLWALALMTVAMAAVARVSRGKAIGAVAAIVLLRVVLGESGVLLGRAFGNLGG